MGKAGKRELQAFQEIQREGNNIAATRTPVSGKPPPSVSWYRNGRFAGNSSRGERGGLVRNELLLENLGRRDVQTQLTCNATNNNRSTPLSASVRLHMNCEYQTPSPLSAPEAGHRRPLRFPRRFDGTPRPRDAILERGIRQEARGSDRCVRAVDGPGEGVADRFPPPFVSLLSSTLHPPTSRSSMKLNEARRGGRDQREAFPNRSLYSLTPPPPDPDHDPDPDPDPDHQSSNKLQPFLTISFGISSVSKALFP
jgi:hypothetical protein